MKIPTPDKRKGTRKREACIWNEVTVTRILQNETYAGVWRYGKRERTNGGKRPIEETIPVSVPAILDRELWEASQERREYNKRVSKRNCKHEYLLRGLGRCGDCGNALKGCATKGRNLNLYYRCCQRDRRFAGLEYICTQKAVRADVLEATVWDYILGLWSNKERFKRMLRDAQKAELDSLQPKRERLAAIDGLIKQCEREAEDTARAMKQARGLIGQKLERDAEEVNQRHEALTKERGELHAALNARTITDETIAAALRRREEIIVGLHDPTFEDKRRMLEFLRVKVTVKDGQAWIQSIAPVKVTPIDLHYSQMNCHTTLRCQFCRRA